MRHKIARGRKIVRAFVNTPNMNNLRRHLDVAHHESFVAAKEEIASGSSAPKKKQTVSVKIDAS